MKGALKSFSYEKGYGWIRVEGRDTDLYFHISQYQDADELKPGTRLIFEIGPGTNNREQAVRVKLDQQAPHTTKPSSRPYHGKVTYKIPGVFSQIFGTVASERVESKCLQCGGHGNPTAIDSNHIGFQCEKCLRYWREPNREGIRPNQVFRLDDLGCPNCGSKSNSTMSTLGGVEFRCMKCKNTWAAKSEY